MIEMIRRKCPHCGAVRDISDVTRPEAQRVGLVYLRMRCQACNISASGAGKDLIEALELLDEQLEKRIGTSADVWRIKPIKGKKR